MGGASRILRLKPPFESFQWWGNSIYVSKADITAGEVVVRGNLKGNIFARGRIEVRNDGAVTGDLITPQVFIEEGALFKGSIEIEKGTEKEAVLPEKESGPAKVTAAAAGGSHV